MHICLSLVVCVCGIDIRVFARTIARKRDPLGSWPSVFLHIHVHIIYIYIYVYIYIHIHIHIYIHVYIYMYIYTYSVSTDVHIRCISVYVCLSISFYGFIVKFFFLYVQEHLCMRPPRLSWGPPVVRTAANVISGVLAFCCISSTRVGFRLPGTARPKLCGQWLTTRSTGVSLSTLLCGRAASLKSSEASCKKIPTRDGMDDK